MKKIILILLALVSTASAEIQQTDVRYSSVTPVVSASPDYSAGDAVGGLMTFTSVCKTTNTIQVNSVTITDKANQAVAYDLQLFSSNPTNTTFTDNSALDVNTSDLAKLLPVISLNTTDHFSYVSNGISSLSSLDSGGFVTVSGGVIYGILVARSTTNLASVSDLVVRLGYKCN